MRGEGNIGETGGIYSQVVSRVDTQAWKCLVPQPGCQVSNKPRCGWCQQLLLDPQGMSSTSPVPGSPPWTCSWGHEGLGNRPWSLHKALGLAHWAFRLTHPRVNPTGSTTIPAPGFCLFPKACWDKRGKQRGDPALPHADLELELCQCSHTTFPRAALDEK